EAPREPRRPADAPLGRKGAPRRRAGAHPERRRGDAALRHLDTHDGADARARRRAARPPSRGRPQGRAPARIGEPRRAPPARPRRAPAAVGVPRAPAAPVAFGFGVHFCLGAALARLEARVALEELLATIPDFAVEPAGLVRVHSGNVRGYSAVPVTFRAR